LYIFANFRDDNVSNNNFLVDFVERDLLEWLAGLEPVQDVYDNERGDHGDRAESDDELSDEEEEIAHFVPFKCIGAAHVKNY
jgi:hypothetical protein